ncbi:hypothetical protein DN576_13745, partial [Burkholderia multivorans]
MSHSLPRRGQRATNSGDARGARGNGRHARSQDTTRRANHEENLAHPRYARRCRRRLRADATANVRFGRDDVGRVRAER